MGKLTDWLLGPKEEEEEEKIETVDQLAQQRKREKFSGPLIYGDEDFGEEIKEEPKVKEEKPKEEVKKTFTPKIPPKKEEKYVMTHIISPMSGLRVSKEEEPIIKKQTIKKKKFKKKSDELTPIISPFYGPDEEEEEIITPTVKEKKTVKTKVNIKEENEDSVENRLRNIASLTEETADDLKIIEERTGKFKLDFKNDDSTLIDEIDDNMSLDELMNLYEKKFKE